MPISLLSEQYWGRSPFSIFLHNNSLKKPLATGGEKPSRSNPARREELEATSRRFCVKYLLSVTNSSAARSFLRANRRSNIHLYPDDWKKLPIRDATLVEQAPVISLVDQILLAKRTDPAADVSALECEIDRLLYTLYVLTPEEIALMEETMKW